MPDATLGDKVKGESAPRLQEDKGGNKNYAAQTGYKGSKELRRFMAERCFFCNSGGRECERLTRLHSPAAKTILRKLFTNWHTGEKVIAEVIIDLDRFPSRAKHKDNKPETQIICQANDGDRPKCSGYWPENNIFVRVAEAPTAAPQIFGSLMLLLNPGK